MQKYKGILISELGNKTVLAVKDTYADAINAKKNFKSQFNDQIIIQPMNYYEM